MAVVLGGKSFGLAAVALGLAAFGCGSSPSASPSETATSEIQGGELDNAAHPFAVGVCTGRKGNCFGTCSGALIAPNLVVTARHCVEDSPERIDCKTAQFGARRANSSNLFITTNAKMNQATLGWHGTKKVITPTPTAVCGNDIALIILSDQVAASEASPVTPAIQYDLIDRRPFNAFEGFTAVGYGITGPDNQDSGTRRLRRNIRTLCIPGDAKYDCQKLGIPADQSHPNEFIGGDGTCSGDSGSSAYANTLFRNSSFVSMGVLSRGGVSDDGTTCLNSVYTRLDSWRQFIVDGAKEASNNWTLYPEPTWTTYTPPVPTTPPATPKELGAGCAKHTDCASGLCAAESDTLVCTQACDPNDASSCPDGFSCDESASQCFATSAEPKDPTSKGDDDDDDSDDSDSSSEKKKNDAKSNDADASDGSGCSVSADPTKPVPWKSLGMLGLVALAAVSRRRRR